MRISGIDAKIEQLDDRARSLVREIKKVGPSLKEVRMKIHKEWLPVWLKDPHAWRAGTKMPTFRLDDDEIKRHRRLYLAIRRDRRSAASRRPAIRKRAKKLSKPAAAWPAIPWARAARSRAAPSPPI